MCAYLRCSSVDSLYHSPRKRVNLSLECILTRLRMYWRIGKRRNLQIGPQVQIVNQARSHRTTDRALAEHLPSWGVLVLESHHSPRFSMDWRTHRFVKIIYVLRGSGVIYFGSRKQAFSTGDVIVVAPGVRNKIEDSPQEAASLYVCCVAILTMHFDRDLPKRLATGVIRGDASFAHRVASVMRRLVHTQDLESATRPISMVADALRLVQMIAVRPGERIKTGRSAKAKQKANSEALARDQVRQYIRVLPTLFFEETSIDQVASSLGMSRRSFTRTFAELAGETWLVHVRRLAIEHAKRRLAE